ncbi:PKD domain-containing protein [Sphingobacterium sp. ML3W]|uniref:PKD domain-containing protein n=1 Tax=Sphingobacterium sp. ML3W TaxID=1538644 RepID=UPI000689A6F5|nr:PKD domain-containing protein [Sphingobacterium sp. ML3W]
MKIINLLIGCAFLLGMYACSKDDVVVEEVIQLPNPQASFSFKQVSADDPFTFQFTNEGLDFTETRWSFGDDSTSANNTPVHTFLNTGAFTIKLMVLNKNGDWAQREEVIKIEPEKLLEFDATSRGNGNLNLSFKTKVAIDSVRWIKGKIDGSLVSKDKSTNINVPIGTFADYTLYAYTPKGSKMVVYKMLTDLGIVKDWTNIDNTFTVSQDNSSGADANEGSKKLIDNDVLTKIFVGEVRMPYFAQFVFYQPRIINAYTLTSGNDADTRDPKNWEIQGSDDGEKWITLDSQEDQLFDARNLSVTYTFNNVREFIYYRYLITSVRDGGNYQMSELRFLELPR